LLKKGRGLRKRTRGGPEEAETPAEQGEAVGPREPDAETALAGPEDAAEPLAFDAAEVLEVLETVEVIETADTVEVVETVEVAAVTEAPAVPVPHDDAAPGVDAMPDDDEPPPPPARPVPVPEGPVLETAKLPDVAVEPNGIRPLTLPRVIAIANQKGGVGKTTTTVNLGAALAEVGFRVLVLDLDPQGNASTGLGLNPRDVEGSVYDVLLNDVALEDIIEPTSLKNLFVAPATIDLAGAEIELVPVMSRELKLKKAIDQVRDQYDLVLIDCPPSLGLLTVNGLAASDDVIVPIQCEYYALEGLGQLLRNVGLVQANLNPALDIRGIILTMYDARTKLADQVVTEVRAYFGEKVYETVVPRTVRLSEAPSFGQPIIVFDSTSRGAKAYRDLAKEVSRGATGRAG
jgi:chromosome partitioning protein